MLPGLTVRSSVQAHDHAVLVYREEAELLDGLFTFLNEGREREEVTVFVHSFASEEEAWGFVERRIPDARSLGARKLVLVSLYTDAFEQGGRIDHAHVGGVVSSLQALSAANSRQGVRIFVDASRQYFARGRVSEWFAFEAWLCPRLDASVGLVCAYRRDDLLDPTIVTQVLRTHGYRFASASA